MCVVFVLPSVWLVSVLLSSGSPAAVPQSTSVSLSECPTLCPKPASVETTDGGYFYLVAVTKRGL